MWIASAMMEKYGGEGVDMRPGGRLISAEIEVINGKKSKYLEDQVLCDGEDSWH